MTLLAVLEIYRLLITQMHHKLLNSQFGLRLLLLFSSDTPTNKHRVAN